VGDSLLREAVGWLRWLRRNLEYTPPVKQSVSVEIAGQTLSIRSDEGPQYVQELADYVDAHLRELTDGRRSFSLQRMALLVAMQIADELFREKDLQRRYRARVEARLQALEAAIVEHEAELAATGE
jgi:cell division protein ZapA